MNTQNQNVSPSRSGESGFTLAEVMVALTIFSMLGLGIAQFLIDSNQIILSSTGKLQINKDIRDFTEEMGDEAREANSFLLYRSFYPVTTSDPIGNFRNPPSSVDPADYRKRVGESGDLVVFIYEAEDPNPRDNLTPISRLVGYYRDGTDTDTSQAPVKRFEVDVDTDDQYDSVESLIPAPGTSRSHIEVLKLAEGLANGMLFHNFNDRSVLVNAKIVHGNAAKQITGTYNFTVSPRG